VSLPQVGRIFGWSASTTVRMSLRYGHVGQVALRKAVETLDPSKPDKPEQTDNQQTPPPAPQPEITAPTTATVH